MKVKAVNEWLSLVANLGVLLGIVVLIFELNQNTRITQITAYQDVVENITNLNSMILTDPDVARLRMEELSGAQLSEIDEQRYAAYYRMLLRQSELAYTQYENGFIDRNMVRRALNPLLDHTNRSGSAARRWENSRESWPEFYEFVNSFR